jgi:transcription elongation GreA/GreB family factor
MLPSKSRVIAALQERAKEALEAAQRAQAIATDEATSEHSKSEGKYDTRATEASYLARGQAQRVVQLRDLVAWYDQLDREASLSTVCPGALVRLEGDRSQTLFVSPVGGGSVDVDGIQVKTISLASPLGRALSGLMEGDDVEFKTPGGTKELEILQLL